MRKRKLSSLAVFLSSIAISFFIPVAVDAADGGGGTDPKTTIEHISDADCKDGCNGHVITGSNISTIQIQGNGLSIKEDPQKIIHKVTLKDLTITTTATTDLPPLSIIDHAKVELTLEGNNTLTSNAEGYAGIYVESGSQLTISGKDNSDTHTLTVQGASRGSGIGGQGMDSPGDIIINSGTITATGGAMAAGIGCGDKGRCGNITITGGTITATGGNTAKTNDADNPGVEIDCPAGAGIGRGGRSEVIKYDDPNIDPKTIPSVTLSGGTIIAKGGDNTVVATSPKAPSAGIDTPILSSSKDGSSNIAATLSDDTRMVGFNGIIWNKVLTDDEIKNGEKRKGTIYGSAYLDKPVQTYETLVFDSKASLAIPIQKDENGKPIPLTCAGMITGFEDNSIIGSIKEIGKGDISGKIERKVILQKEDFKIPTDLVYTSNDLTKEALARKYERRPIDGKKDGAEIVTEGWEPPKIVNRKDKTETILTAGTYDVMYSNTKYPADSFSFEITVAPAPLENVVINPIDNQTYNGKGQEPALKITYNDNPVAESDYKVSYTSDTDNVNIGTATVTLRDAGGNFKGTKTTTYEIDPAPLTNAEVSISSEKEIYNGSEHNPTITVSSDIVLDNDGNPTRLTKDKDYTITASRDGEETTDYRSAGKIVYTIQGKGNYQGTAKTLEYEIEQKVITVSPNSPIKISNKLYDENNKFELSGVEFDDVLSADRSEVKLEVGYVAGANVGSYNRITFDPKDLSGSKGSNYTFAEGTGLDLNPAVEIEQVTPTVYTPTASYEPNADLNAFICTVEIDKQPGIDYEFKMDEDGDWRAGTPSEDGSKCTSPAFADIAPLSKHTFYVRSIGNDNVKQVDMDNVEVEFKKLPNPNKAPESCELAFTANSDGRTFTATITPAGLEGAQYCIKPTDADDSQLITLDSNTYTNCAPLTSYTAYIRYPGNDVYEPSEAATATAETEKAPLADAKPQYTPVLTRINASNPTDEYMTSDLRSMYGTMSDVLSDMAKRLSEDYPDIYSHDRIEYYELNLMVQRYNPDGTLSEPTPATEDDFKQADGSFGSITVQLKASDLPSGTNPNRNTYAIAHMFATPIGSHFAGDIETSPGTPGGGGITFDVNGTSPIAIAYSAANSSEDPGNEDPGNDPGNEDPGNEDPGNEDPGNDPGNEDPGNDPNGDNNNNGNTDNNGNNGNTDNNGNTGNNGDTGTTGGTDGNGTNGGTGTTGGTDGNGTNGGTGTTGTGGNSAVDALKSAAASLLPKTGDTSKIIVWVIAAIAACIAVVAVIRNNSKKGKAATATASGGKATATTKKTAATAAKKSTTTAAKKTTTSTKKTTATATKKTTTTKKGR